MAISRSYRDLRTDCGLSQDDWELLIANVKEDLREPENSIGLGGPIRYGVLWGNWLDEYLDNGIGERYWGVGKYKMWDFSVYKRAIRSFMRVLIRIAAGCERGQITTRLKRQAAQAAKAAESQEKGSIVDGQEREKSEENQETYGSEKAESKKERENMQLNDPPSPHDISVNYPTKPDIAFQTRLAGSSRIKFVYPSDTASVQEFSCKVYERFGLGSYQGIASIEAEVDGKAYIVDFDDKRDWQQVVRIAGVSGSAEIIVETVPV